jgi:hypothetical protein
VSDPKNEEDLAKIRVLIKDSSSFSETKEEDYAA